MQKESKSGTSKPSNSGARPRNPRTPENQNRNVPADVTLHTMNRTTNSRQRITMAPGDIMIPLGLNPTLSQILAQVPPKSELEHPEHELGLLYDKYLQAKAAELVVESKIMEKERLITAQMVAVSKEREIAKKNFEKAKLREYEVRNANVRQIAIDAQKNELITCFDDLRKNKVKDKLLELKMLLEPLDELHCQGIEIPEDSDSCKELFNNLEAVGEVLKSIQEYNGDEGNLLKHLENGLNSLRGKHAEIECVKKKFDEVLCGLQALVLKDASHSLSANYTDDFCHDLAK